MPKRKLHETKNPVPTQHFSRLAAKTGCDSETKEPTEEPSQETPDLNIETKTAKKQAKEVPPMVTATEKTTKRKRQNEAVDWATDLHSTVYKKIFNYLDPGSAIKATLVCNSWAKLFPEEGFFDWKSKLEQFTDSKVEPLKGLTYRQLIGLVTLKGCQLCGDEKRHCNVYWVFRRKLCKSCLKAKFITDAEVMNLTTFSKYIEAYHSLPYLTFKYGGHWGLNGYGGHWRSDVNAFIERRDVEEVKVWEKSYWRTADDIGNRLKTVWKNVIEAEKNKRSQLYQQKKRKLHDEREEHRKEILAMLDAAYDQYETRFLELCPAVQEYSMKPSPLSERTTNNLKKKIEARERRDG